jgi:hypothetical protein
MALKYKFKTKDEVPVEHLALYAERDGAWVLDVEGAVEKAKLDEFRNTNVAFEAPHASTHLSDTVSRLKARGRTQSPGRACGRPRFR